MSDVLTIPQPQPSIPPSGPLVGEQRISIQGVSYQFYKHFCEEVGEQPIRLSFNEGCLEIMVTKSPHEFFKKLLAKLVEAAILELAIPVRSGGAMTFQRDDLEKGFEPDECWWIEHESIVRRVTDFDFRLHPPPDLAVEIEISHSLTNRIGIFAALGVAEIWRFDGHRLRFCLLGPNQTYQDATHSRAFPWLQPQDLIPYLTLPDDVDETTRIRRFVTWLRSNILEHRDHHC
jgi:Uma2 family endonuclease